MVARRRSLMSSTMRRFFEFGAPRLSPSVGPGRSGDHQDRAAVIRAHDGVEDPLICSSGWRLDEGRGLMRPSSTRSSAAGSTRAGSPSCRARGRRRPSGWTGAPRPVHREADHRSVAPCTSRLKALVWPAGAGGALEDLPFGGAQACACARNRPPPSERLGIQVARVQH